MNNDIIQKNNDDISHHLLQWPSLDRKCPVPAHQKLATSPAALQQGIFQIETRRSHWSLSARQAKSSLSRVFICYFNILFHWIEMSAFVLMILLHFGSIIWFAYINPSDYILSRFPYNGWRAGIGQANLRINSTDAETDQIIIKKENVTISLLNVTEKLWLLPRRSRLSEQKIW